MKETRMTEVWCDDCKANHSLAIVGDDIMDTAFELADGASDALREMFRARLNTLGISSNAEYAFNALSLYVATAWALTCINKLGFGHSASPRVSRVAMDATLEFVRRFAAREMA